MNKLKICLIDDKKYGIEQIKNSIPENIKYDFFYFESYKNCIGEKFEIILLDYYLDLDNEIGTNIIKFLKYDILIGFSSVNEKSEIMKNFGCNYAVQKLKSNQNNELKLLFTKIFSQINKNKVN